MKQETLEEAANKLLWKKYPYNPPKDAGYWKDMFSEGAKWQMERSYSEEEIKNMLIDMSHYISTKELRDNFESEYSEWIRKRDWFINYLFEQFKKK